MRITKELNRAAKHLPKQYKGIVLVPCWRRPEILWCCLHYISQAEGFREYLYYFSIDRAEDKRANLKPSNEVYDVIDKFAGDKVVKRRKAHSITGNTYNLLEGYRECLEIAEANDIPLIYMIETDIYVSKDFFQFHEKCHGLETLQSPFFVSACRNQNLESKTKESANPQAVYPHNSYQSLGVSFGLNSVKRFLKHANTRYYAGMKPYLRSVFPNSRLGTSCVEQDGMINRLVEKENLMGIYPEVPRAYHAGYYGYNRPGHPVNDKNLTLYQKFIANLAMTEDEMNSRATRKEYKDITKCRMSGYFVDEIKLKTKTKN